MKITKNTEPYSFEQCEWDRDAKAWLFSWGEEIPNAWVDFSIENQVPVESINQAYELDPTNFMLNISVIEEILENNCDN